MGQVSNELLGKCHLQDLSTEKDIADMPFQSGTSG